MTSHKSAKPESSFNFSQSMKELEDIASYLEQSDVDLEQAIDRFERGAQLAKELKQYLAQAENRVNQLKQEFSTTTKSVVSEAE